MPGFGPGIHALLAAGHTFTGGKSVGRLILAVAAFAFFPAITVAQTDAIQVAGRTCIGPYDVRGFTGTTLVRFLKSDQPGTVTVERYRITEANRAKLAQAHGGNYDVSSPDRVTLEDFETLGGFPAMTDSSKAENKDYPIIGHNGQNEWRARLNGDKLDTYTVQWDRSDPKLNGIIKVVVTNTVTCTRPKS
jgi:hypothetical protein